MIDMALLTTTLGMVPFLTSRAFLPLLASALVVRFGTEWGYLAQALGVSGLGVVPDWATSDAALAVLAGGAVIEHILRTQPDLREAIELTDRQLKAVLAFGMCLILAADASAHDATTHLWPLSSPTAYASVATGWGGGMFGFGWPLLAWALLIAALVGTLAGWRAQIVGVFRSADEEDSLGLGRLLGWAESAFSFFGVLLVIALPLIAALAALLAALVLYGARSWVRRAEKSSHINCDQCQASIVACAPHCASCHGEQPRPHSVGFLGAVGKETITDRARHALELKKCGRCAHCGQRLARGGLETTCKTCGTQALRSQHELDNYLAAIRSDLPLTLLLLFVLGSIPVLGLVLGMVALRLSLVPALKQYAPFSSRLKGTWMVRITNALLLCLQPLPMVGAFTLPLVALNSYYWFKNALTAAASRQWSSDSSSVSDESSALPQSV